MHAGGDISVRQKYAMYMRYSCTFAHVSDKSQGWQGGLRVPFKTWELNG